jgi:hypothetical protein
MPAHAVTNFDGGSSGCKHEEDCFRATVKLTKPSLARPGDDVVESVVRRDIALKELELIDMVRAYCAAEAPRKWMNEALDEFDSLRERARKRTK